MNRTYFRSDRQTGFQVKSLVLVAFCRFVFLMMPVASGDDSDPSSEIAKEAKGRGDAAAGALVFYSPQLGCVRCHLPGGAGVAPIGPNLAIYPADERPSDTELVEAILHPSKRIRKGYESSTILTTDGRTITGRVLKRDEKGVTIQEATGQFISIGEDEIEQTRSEVISTMPAGLADQIGSRTQFVNLVRFLIDIRDGGEERFAGLRPATAGVFADSVAPHESSIDHVALIEDSSADVLQRGEAIYTRVCANCHGTMTEVGSLPSSLRFGEGKFKNGSDPHSMYRTLTYGFGMMTPQHWMVPKQKYAVIHYIRDHFLKERNRSQWYEIGEGYLASLPKGDSLGPEPSEIEPWNSMDYGPTLTHTYQVSRKPLNIAYKGVAIRLDPGQGGIARGKMWTIFDTDTLRWAAGWQAGDNGDRFIDWRGIQFNGQHNIHPSIAGKVIFSNRNGPGWAEPETGSFDDTQRVEGRDGRRYGPLPKSWGKYIGQYRLLDSVVVAYQVGDTVVNELPGHSAAVPGEHGDVFLRTLWVGPRKHGLKLRVAELASSEMRLRLGVRSTQDGIVTWETDEKGQVLLRLEPGDAMRVELGIAEDMRPAKVASANVSFDLEIGEPMPDGSNPWLRGGPAMWATQLQTTVMTKGAAAEPFLVDDLQVPTNNPWSAQMRCTGVDFFDDGSMAVCTWDGDVWKVNIAGEGDDGASSPEKLTWRRIATGLFQPLGIKIVEGQIYVTCRDQLARLRDLNDDGEIDFYESFNNDHQVTEHFHEFAMGLQRDEQGNFYYAKSARHALKAIVPHHGTLLKVTPDGGQTEIIANGFRAANGVCLNPDGTFFVTDQEGHWNPKNRINLVTTNPGGEPRFYGNMFGYTSVTDSSDEAMEKPLCWITNGFDRSPGELLWVTSERWGFLEGELLELSYGMGRAYLVLREQVGESYQGGMVALPIPDFPTGVMRGRFRPKDGQLYLCGMFAWAGNAQLPGGLYRIRRTEAPLNIPVGLRSSKSGLAMTFSRPLSLQSIDASKVAVKVWSLERSANYGSKHLDEKGLEVKKASLDADGRTVRLEIPIIGPTWCMEIEYNFADASGQPVVGKIDNTIHALGERATDPPEQAP